MAGDTRGNRTLQNAADIAANCNGQQMSVKPLQRWWKDELQIALPSSHVPSSPLATSAAVACARLPSAPCGVRFERLDVTWLALGSRRFALRHGSARWGRLLLA